MSLNNLYVRIGATVAVIGASLVVGLRFALARTVRGRVVEGETVPKLSSAYIKGKRVLVVGGTSGLGLAIGQELVKNGAYVSVVGRTDPKVVDLKFLKANLATVKAQTELAETVPNPETLDILLFTQGIMTTPQRQDNGEGIELDLAVSYVGRRVVLEKLLERGAKPKRVFIMGFSGSETEIDDFNGEKNYKPFPQHLNTVVSNDALVLGLRKRRPDLSVYGLNPGLIKTGIRSNMYGNSFFSSLFEGLIGIVAPTPQTYAKQIVNVIGAESLSKNAVFFNSTGEAIHSSKYLADQKNVEMIWSETDKLIERAVKKSK